MYYSKSNVYFIVNGDNFSPNDLTELIQINPTDVGNKGEQKESWGTLRQSFWKFELEETNALEELEDSLTILIQLFKNKEQIVKNFCEINELKIKIFVTIKVCNNEDTGVIINKDLINFLYRIGGIVEVDIY